MFAKTCFWGSPEGPWRAPGGARRAPGGPPVGQNGLWQGQFGLGQVVGLGQFVDFEAGQLALESHLLQIVFLTGESKIVKVKPWRLDLGC